MVNGVVKRIIADKGFGFIRDTAGQEWFFHRSACLDLRFEDLKEQMAVQFDVGSSPKGPRAENIRLRQ